MGFSWCPVVQVILFILMCPLLLFQEPGESLSLDFPEIDLSQLDAGDFDTNSCFNELQWCNDQSENESSQYSTDDSELFQVTIDSSDIRLY